MATIVSSTVLTENIQRDGRLWIVEQFTDSLGVVYTMAPRLVPAAFNAAVDLPIIAANVLANAVANEIAANVQVALTSSGAMTFNYCTPAQVIAALQGALATATSQQISAAASFLAVNTQLVAPNAITQANLKSAVTAVASAQTTLNLQVASVSGASVVV